MATFYDEYGVKVNIVGAASAVKEFKRVTDGADAMANAFDRASESAKVLRQLTKPIATSFEPVVQTMTSLSEATRKATEDSIEHVNRLIAKMKTKEGTFKVKGVYSFPYMAKNYGYSTDKIAKFEQEQNNPDNESNPGPTTRAVAKDIEKEYKRQSNQRKQAAAERKKQEAEEKASNARKAKAAEDAARRRQAAARQAAKEAQAAARAEARAADAVIQSLRKLKKQVGRVSFSDLTRQCQSFGITAQVALSRLGLSMTQVTRSSTALTQALGDIDSKVKATTSDFFKLRSIILTIIGAFWIFGSSIGNWFSAASEYAEANHLLFATLSTSLGEIDEASGRAVEATSLFGNSIQSTAKYTAESASAIEDILEKLDRLAASRGLDPTQFKRVYATFYEIGNAAGVAADILDDMSTGLTQLSYDYGSLFDTDFETVASKFQSALSGVTSAVKGYGIDVSRTAADAWLMEHGIDAQYNALDRASKMMLIYTLMIEHAQTAQDDLASSIKQPANQLRVLKEQATVAARALGAALFPMITPLIGVLIGLAQAATKAATAIQAFLGSLFGSYYTDAAEQWSDFFTSLSASNSDIESVTDSVDDLSDSASDAASAAEDIKNALMGFDEINNISINEETSSGSSSGDSSGIDIASQLEGLIAKSTEWTDDVISRLVQNAKTILLSGFAAIFQQLWTVEFVKAARVGFEHVDFVSGIGRRLLAVVDLFAAAFLHATPMRSLIDAFDSIGDVVRSIVPELTTQLQRPFRALGQFISGLLPAASTLLSVIFGDGAIAASMSNLSNTFGVLKDAFKAASGLSGLGPILEGIGSKLPILGNIIGIVEVLVKIPEYIDAIANNTMDMGQVVADAIMTFTGFNVIVEIFDRLANPQNYSDINLSEIFSNIGEQVVSFCGTLIPLILGVLVNLPSALLNLVGTLLPVVGELIGTVITFAWETLTTALSNLFSPEWWAKYGLDIVAGLLQGIGTALLGVAEFFYNVFIAPILNILGIASPSTLFADIGGFIIEGLLNGLEALCPNLMALFKDVLSNIFGFFENFGNLVTALFSGDIGGAAEALLGMLTNIFSIIGNVITAPFTALWDVICTIADTIGSIFNIKIELPEIKLPHFIVKPEGWQIGDLLKGEIPSLDIEWYAKGGIVTSPTLGVVGEAGPETVIPLHGAAMRPFSMAIARDLASMNDSRFTSDNSEGEAQVQLLREQNSLLRQILAKDTSVNLDGKSIIKSINSTTSRAGRTLLAGA